MDLRRLRYFVRIADLGSFTRAAAELGIAQPALSRAIRDLETELATQLFRRGRRGVELTEGGRTLRAHADRIFTSVELARSEVHGGSGKVEGIVRVGMPPSVAIALGIRTIAHLSRAQPGVRVHLCESYDVDVQEPLTRGQIDVAILNSKTVNRKGIQTEPLMQDPLYLIAPAGRWPRGSARVGRKTLEQVATGQLILPGRSLGLRILIDEYAAELGITLTPAGEVDSMLVVKDMILRGMGMAILSLPLMRREIDAGLVEAAPLEPPLWRSLVLATGKDRAASLATLAFMEAARSQVRALGSGPQLPFKAN